MRQQERDKSAFLAQTIIEILTKGAVPAIRRRNKRANLPKWLAVPEADDGDRDAGNQAVAREAEGEICDASVHDRHMVVVGTQSISHTIEIQVRVVEVVAVLPSLLKREILQVALSQEVLLPRRASIGQFLLFSDLLTITICALLNHNELLICALLLDLLLRLVVLGAYPHGVHRAEQGAVKVGFVGVNIAVETGVDEPLDQVKSLVESWRELVLNGVVEVVAEDKVIAANVFLEGEVEGERV